MRISDLRTRLDRLEERLASTGPMNFTPGAPRPAVDEFQADLRADVVPCVEKTYRVLSGRGSRAISTSGGTLLAAPFVQLVSPCRSDQRGGHR